MPIESIRKLYREKRFEEALSEVESELETHRECGHLWVLRGNLIQLSNQAGLSLAEAERSYLTALQFEPECVEAMEDLLHFYYAVIEDKAKAGEVLHTLDTKLERIVHGTKKVRVWLNADSAGTQ